MGAGTVNRFEFYAVIFLKGLSSKSTPIDDAHDISGQWRGDQTLSYHTSGKMA